MNTIRELKQQEKYKSMLKRKNKEKKIYKDKNASLQLEKQRLYIALRNKDKEIERLNNIINELSKENQELKEKTKLFHKNGVFSLEYDKETLRDMVLEYQERIDKAIEYIETHQLNFKKGTTTFGSERLSIEERKLLYILKGVDKK